MAIWYDKVESLIGVTGLAHGIENTPDSPFGIQLPPPPPRAHEVFLSRVFETIGMKVAAIRAAILTTPHNNRPACLYATACTRGCSIRATFQSTNVLITPSLETGNLTVRSNAVVNKVEVDESGRVIGVSFNDRKTGELGSVRGTIVVLTAGAYSSVRILLNSKSNFFPNGLGNSNGFVGKYIMDSVEFTMSSRVPALEKIPPQNDDGIFTPHIYVPWWLYKEQADGKLNFPRGYHIEPRGGRRMPTMAVGNYIDRESPLYGSGIREEVCRKYGSYIYLTGEGEMIPNDNTYCEIDSDQQDTWGVPVLKFHWKWGEHEHNQVAHMHTTFNKIFQLIGGRIDPNPPVMPKGGGASHEVGGARMGTSAKDSVVDQFGQCWEAPNLFVLDGATFVSSPDKNPTLTILAIASRGSARIAELIRGGAFDS
jgi:choline dehydrogenase-like flavoprotein